MFLDINSLLKQFHYIFPSPEGEGFLIPEGGHLKL
ncbi:hypothetical protein REIS_0349 [Rickettsia endosymbiont of Ixodes scapularis]|nr:hypothetical protein REIS_0349 [Rickettsia endosymbiont of Ixodes scapularis]